jgi:hypothetical protein
MASFISARGVQKGGKTETTDTQNSCKLRDLGLKRQPLGAKNYARGAY